MQHYYRCMYQYQGVVSTKPDSGEKWQPMLSSLMLLDQPTCASFSCSLLLFSPTPLIGLSWQCAHLYMMGMERESNPTIGWEIQWDLSKTTVAHGTFKTWCLLPGGLLIQGYLTGNSIPWSCFQWSSRKGCRLIRVVALTGFTVHMCNNRNENRCWPRCHTRWLIGKTWWGTSRRQV